MNEIFRQQGEPTYFTPMAIIAAMVDHQDATEVTMIQPPYKN